jgi:hypothetical protein
MGSSSSNIIITSLAKVLKHPSLYYLICLLILLRLDAHFTSGLRTTVDIIFYSYLISFPIVFLIYSNIKSLKDFVLFFFLLVILNFLCMFIKAGFDYGLYQYYGGFFFSIFSALFYAIIDLIFIILSAKLIRVNILTRKIRLSLTLFLFLTYFILTYFKLTEFYVKIYSFSPIFFLLWDYVSKHNKLSIMNKEMKA